MAVVWLNRTKDDAAVAIAVVLAVLLQPALAAVAAGSGG
jgi:hypothetical protein